MAIEQEYNNYIPVCDGCLETLSKCMSFQDALDVLKDAGWKNIKVNGIWQCRCPNCQETVRHKPQGPKFLDW